VVRVFVVQCLLLQLRVQQRRAGMAHSLLPLLLLLHGEGSVAVGAHCRCIARAHVCVQVLLFMQPLVCPIV
jgi:hypothetical protein